jgi:hypothetical protein
VRNILGLRRGGGRPKGSPNRTTKEIKAFAAKFLSSREYIDSAKCRVLKGDAPHLETLWHHYAFGKPKEIVAVEGEIPPFIVKLDAPDA